MKAMTIEWHDVRHEPMPIGTTIIVAARNKNKPDGIALYDVCEYYGIEEGKPHYEGRSNYEDVVYWAYLHSPLKD